MAVDDTRFFGQRARPAAPGQTIGEALSNPAGTVNDVLAKDETVKLSELLRRNRWGSANTANNIRARRVIECESSHDTDVVATASCSPNGQEHAVGLMQICTVHRGKFGIPKDYDKAVKFLQNPDNNVRVGRQLHRQDGWQPWNASRGCWLHSTSKADPDITVKKNTVTSVVGDVVDPLLSPLDAIADFFSALTHGEIWFRIGKTAGGFLLISGGVLMLLLAGGKKVSRSKAGRAALTLAPTTGAANKAVRMARAAGR